MDFIFIGWLGIAGAGQASDIAKAIPAPPGWKFYAPRDEIAPRFWVDQNESGALLCLAGKGDEAVDGRWIRRLPVKAGKHYVFQARYRAKDVRTPNRSILARLLWFGADKKQIGRAEYPYTAREPVGQGWEELSATYQAPDEAVEAQLELHLRWSAKGQVRWLEPTFLETSPPPPRTVVLASVNHRPRGTGSSRKNLDEFAGLVREVARKGADIVCLPEGITVVGTGFKYADVAEPIPGPSTEFLGKLAGEFQIYIVAGLYEREEKAIFNTSILLDRTGGLLGKYRKVCLPREEIDGGITPGKEYPVFRTDFGQVAMMICWDVHFPEVARELARKGAEVIFLPIWGGNEILAQARAIENQIHLVASGYDFQTAIFDPRGEKIAQSSNHPEVILTEVDLNRRFLWPWLGDWRARIWREGPEGDR